MPGRWRTTALGVVSALALAACTVMPVRSAAGDADAPSTVEALWAARTAYVGDNSRVITLVRAAGFGDLGEYTISLQSDTEPYGLTVDLDAHVAEADVSGPAALVLGLVGNLDEVSVSAGDDVYTYTAASASADLGHDVKELGADQERLAAAVQAVQPVAGKG